MTTEPNLEFTVEERSAIADLEANARLVLGITELKPGEQAPPVTGQTPTFVTVDDVFMAGTLATLREAGLTDEVLAEVAAGKPITADERRIAEDWQRRAMKDQEFIRKLLGGDPDAQRLLLCASIALSSEIRK